MEQVEVGSVPRITVAYRRAGSGPPLLLLHGAVCDSRVWRNELDEFASDHTVLAWDAPGCGVSGDPRPNWGMADYSSCLAELLDRIGIRRAHVLGHSWGSTVALCLAIARPDLVRSLVLVGGYAGWGGSLPAADVEQRLALALQLADSVDAGSFEPRSIPGLFSDRMPADRTEELLTIMEDVRPVGIRVMARALAEADLRDLLGEVEAPTLLLVGEEDERSPVAVSEALHRALPRSSLVVLPDAGHECALEAPGPFQAAVRAFLRSDP